MTHPSAVLDTRFPGCGELFSTLGAKSITISESSQRRRLAGEAERYNQGYIDHLLQCSTMGSGRGATKAPMETGITIQNPSFPVRTANFFYRILPPTGLILGLVLTTVWISFLGYQIVRLVEAAL
jgi:hypothetical protein